VCLYILVHVWRLNVYVFCMLLCENVNVCHCVPGIVNMCLCVCSCVPDSAYVLVCLFMCA